MAVNWRLQGNLKKISSDIKKYRTNAVVYGVGDASHQSRKSDHNPYNWGYGIVVSAIDVMIRNGFTKKDACLLVKMLKGRSDIQYIIYNRTIWSASWGWTPKRYTGSDPHTDHVHVSAKHSSSADKDGRGVSFVAEATKPKPGAKPVVNDKPSGKTPTKAPVKKPAAKKPAPPLKEGMKGPVVRKLQIAMNKVFPSYSKLVEDGDFGGKTKAVMMEFQARAGLKVDGIVGDKTRIELRKHGVQY